MVIFEHQITRKRFLGVAGSAIILSLTTARQGSAQMPTTKWMMGQLTFEKSILNPLHTDLREAAAGDTFFIHARDVPLGAYPDLVIRPSTIVRDFYDIQPKIDSGELGAGGNLVWAMEYPAAYPEKRTPEDQIRNYETVLADSYALVKSAGATMVVAPATAIMDVLTPNAANERESLLNNRIPAKMAIHADGYDVQAQQSEQNVESYRDYVRRALDLARSTHPGLWTFAGLTTASPGSNPSDFPTYNQMYDAAMSVDGFTGGFWLNVPEIRNSVDGERDFQTARRFLRRYYGLPALI